MHCHQFNVIFSTVCNAGHFVSNGVCSTCTGNRVKPEVGNTTDCPVVCDETTMLPNSERTACGEFLPNLPKTKPL